MTTAAVRRDDLLLQRFFSLFLFAGAFFFGVATFVAAAKVASGDVRAAGMLLGCGLPSAALVWVGVALWAGRGVPRWFMASFLVLIGFGPLLLACLGRTWSESLTMLAVAVPTVVSVYPTLREYWRHTAKPAPRNEA